jgi:hypothetical protein
MLVAARNCAHARLAARGIIIRAAKQARAVVWAKYDRWRDEWQQLSRR